MSVIPPLKENISAVIVTFHPDIHLPERTAQIAKQVDHIVIVDNNSPDTIREMLHALARQHNVHLILNQQNMGIATALNQGLRWAKHAGYSWAVTFDQDSLIQDSMIKELCDVFCELNQKEKIAIIGSNFRAAKSGRIFFKNRNMRWSECRTVITAGSLMSLNIFDETGGFRDDFFIDFVDYEYCLRCRKKGYKIIILCKPLIEQTFGNPSEEFFLGQKIVITHYPPMRYYFQARNIILLIQEYIISEPLLLSRIILWMCRSIAGVLLYGENKYLKIKNAIDGLYNGLKYKIR